MSDHIPPEVLTDIFKKLTVKDIGRCSCVCKSWYSLITSPAFVSLHTEILISRTPNPLLLVKHCVSIDSFKIYDDSDDFGRHENLLFPFKAWNSNHRVIGCSRGVVCLFNDLTGFTDNIILWNPSIRKALTLPKPLISFKTHGFFRHTIGFGYAAAGDYKVVRVVHLTDHWGDGSPLHAEVHELRVGLWRGINVRKLPYVIDHRSPQAFLNGIVHWLGNERNEWMNKMIVSFDMKEEVFGGMKMPDCVGDEQMLRVSVVGELLSLISLNFAGGIVSCNVWLMKQYGVCDSWTKHFSVELTGGLREVYGFRRNGEALLSKNIEQGTALASYKPDREEVKYIEIFESGSSFEVENFVESLALLDVKVGQSSVNLNNTVISMGHPDDAHVQKKKKIQES